ncbi:MAG: PDZ domain-containing protein [Alphaproteobacteria bacterium]|nr:PDZ domain-containing protein [Alphaproteobacteria bacterium]
MNRRRSALLAVALLALVLALLGGRATGLFGDSLPEDDAPHRTARQPHDADDAPADDPVFTDTDAPGGRLAGGAAGAAGTASSDDEARLRERAKQLEEDPNTQVVCDLSIPVAEAEGYLAIGGHSDFNGRRVQVVDGKAYLPLVYDLGELGDAVFTERTGLFSLEGYGPATLSWSDPPEGGGHGRCTATIDPEPGRASLTGTLTLAGSGAPAAGAWVEGCGNMAFADEHGVVHMDIVTDPCTLLAMRQDGLLRTMSDPIPVVPVPGEDVVVDIEIPEARRGGLGVQIAESDAGIVIEGLIEGGPAEAAGLQPGDVVVEVDGESMTDVPLAELVERVGGEAGTSVDLVVDRSGERIELTLVREVLTPG